MTDQALTDLAAELVYHWRQSPSLESKIVAALREAKNAGQREGFNDGVIRGAETMVSVQSQLREALRD